MQLPEKYPETLGEIVGMLAEHLTGPLSPSEAEHLSFAFGECLRRNFGGGILYLPKGQDYELHARNSTIAREFDGRNYRELARRYGLSLNAIYKILSAERQRIR